MSVISTKSGKVKGKVIDLKRKDAKLVNVYRNIPFAKPPVGELRFAPPKPADSWEGVRDGTVCGNMPIYPAIYDEFIDEYCPFPEPDDSKPVTDEDCLHLTVYVPEHKKGTKLPVMVHFYGGGFSFGSERYVDGSVLAGMNDVIVVVPNYRVGILGFLSLGQSSSCSGNFGLMDQQLSLKWVKENIDAFGGDKSNVTIFGESAGAASVHYHILSPLSRGLFHKGISHSGQANMPELIHSDNARTKSNKIMFDHLKINEKENDKILQALKKISANDLTQANVDLMEQKVYFLPVIDGKLLPKSPWLMLKNKEFAKVPYIIGYNSTEGLGVSMMEIEDVDNVTEETAKEKSIMPMSQSAFEECKKFYNKDGKNFGKMLGDLFGDAMFVTPALHAASVHSKAGASIYSYIGNFQLKMHHDKEYGPEVGKKSEMCICDHGDDLYMTFGAPFSALKFPRGVKFSDEETVISRKFMTYLTNFAKTGNPNKGAQIDQKWPKYETGGEQLVVASPFSVVKNSSAESLKFWSEVMSKYLKDATYDHSTLTKM